MDTTAPAVPAEYQDLYDQIYADLASFQDYLDAFPTRQRDSATPVAFAAKLYSGNYNLGPILIQPDHYKQTLMNVDGLKALGVKAINLDISFPFLYHCCPRQSRRIASSAENTSLGRPLASYSG